MYKLLIAEDVKTVRDALARSVPWESIGISLLGTAENGEAALARLELETPDLLLTDIGMPKMNGLELIEACKARNPDIRCIILSGLNEFEHARKAISLQVQQYILKPIDPDEITRVFSEVVRELGRERRQREELAVAESKLRDELPNLAGALPPDEWSGSLKKKRLVEQAIGYIKQNYARGDLALSDVADAVGLSEKYVNLIVKEVTGTTINAWIVRHRLEEAARLLKDPANRIYEICERIGYTDQDYFREVFKKQYGRTPTEYRNSRL